MCICFKIILLVFLNCFLLNIIATFNLYGLEECGKSRACWPYPSGCNSVENCQAIIRWVFQQNKLLIEIQAKPIINANEPQWMAMAFSDDMSMGNDSVMDCIFIGNDKPKMEISYNLFTQNIPLLEASKTLLSEKNFLRKNGIFGCTFIVDYNKINNIPKEERKMILKLNTSNWWHILYAQGPAYESGVKQFHTIYQKTDQLVKICDDCTDKYTVIEQ
uniref:DOMON domain-containing protein n=1 Tax=Meloidogyne enterolobii TaxID=390850 RepID=A0A6V7X588_MELEN|nr:unnamed protein product [Meloidogyne enterolobii]